MSDSKRKIEVMLDNHHVHLRQETVEKLFGEGYVLPQKKYLGGGEYISIDDLQSRAKISSAVVDVLRSVGSLAGLPESSQTTLF